MADVLRAGKPIVPLAGSRYVLMELAANSVPPLLDQPLYRVQLDGWIPILAHPERNSVLQARPEMVFDLINHGVRMQITAGSLTGEFGPAAEKAASAWLEHGLVHFVATDAHHPARRPPRVRAAVERLRALMGEDAAEALTRRNPLAVIENRGLEYEPEPVEPAAGGLLTRLRAFFGRK
jgi:protein-tyrosine phosphatase